MKKVDEMYLAKLKSDKQKEAKRRSVHASTRSSTSTLPDKNLPIYEPTRGIPIQARPRGIDRSNVPAQIHSVPTLQAPVKKIKPSHRHPFHGKVSWTCISL